jgi:hypothetical protein
MEKKSSEGEEKMTGLPPRTPEEEVYEQLLDENWPMLSEGAQTVFSEAKRLAYVGNLVQGFCVHPEEEEEAMDNMRLAAVEFPEDDYELLGKLWRAALGAAASIDPNDRTVIGFKVEMGDIHWYYRMISDMVEQILKEKAREKRLEARE